MAAPHLESDHPALGILAEVAQVLASRPVGPDVMGEVIAVLRRGLSLRRCRLWLRTPDGAHYSAVAAPGDEAQLPAFAAPVAEWIAAGTQREPTPGGILARL